MTGNIAHAGTLTLDAGSNVHIDADGSSVVFLDGGTHMGTLKMANSNINLDSQVVDKDIIFSGNNGGVAVTALTLDMSDSGYATFNAGAHIKGATLIATNSDPTLVLRRTGNAAGNGSIDFQGNDGSVDYSITAAGSTAGALQFSTATSNAMTINSNGYVGIGTTAPESVVNIKTTKTVALSAAAHFLTLGLTIDDSTAYGTEGGGGGIAFRSPRNSSGTQTIYAAIDGAKEGTANDGYTGALKFYTNNNTTGVPTEHLRITSDGRGLSQFTAKCWVNFNGANTVAINDSHNVSSITDNGTGNYSINFSNNLANTNYSVTSMSKAYSQYGNYSDSFGTFNVAWFKVEHREGGSYTDAQKFCANVFGD